MGFFKSAWQSSNREKALIAVEKEENRVKLMQISRDAPIDDVRKVAAEKLERIVQNGYAITAKNALRVDERITAVKNLTDQTLLKGIVFGLTEDYQDFKKYYEVGKIAIEKLNDLDLLDDICNNAKEFSTRLQDFKRLAANRITKLKEEEIKRLSQNELFEILQGKNKNYSTSEALNLFTDENKLLDLAETSDNYALCYDIYLKVKKTQGAWNFTDMLNTIKGTNKSALINYIISNVLVDNPQNGKVIITKSDIDMLASEDEKDLLFKITTLSNDNTFSLKAYTCEKLGKHDFNIYCVCSRCGLQEHIFDYDVNRDIFPRDGCVCDRCKGIITTTYSSYYDGVPGYGETVTSSATNVVYPDGTKDKSTGKYKRK